MPIIPETLKTLREKRGFSQQGLAERAAQMKGGSVSKRTIARIESGEIAPEKVRTHTVESLAKALEVKPEALCKPPTDYADALKTMQEAGYTRISLWLDEDVRLNYRLVMHHYDVSVQDLIDAAPWMFTLLAEMSIAERERRLKEAEASFEDAMAKLPVHLGHASVARSDFENAVGDENDSLRSRDVFGKRVLEGAACGFHSEPFDPEDTNPFVEFLKSIASNLNSSEIDLDDFHHTCNRLPKWNVFRNWLHELTGGDGWARFAVENVKGVVSRLPDHLKGETNTAERVHWLIDQIPPEMKAREEERLAKREAEIEGIVL